MTCRRTKKQ